MLNMNPLHPESLIKCEVSRQYYIKHKISDVVKEKKSEIIIIILIKFETNIQDSLELVYCNI